ncbi:MAG TPA: tetratricopeptide repeat protein [Thermoanaerobaculia bacterium]|nr:tetratricopeptide repeat protein [Thermoanaerobaculia bacterium]
MPQTKGAAVQLAKKLDATTSIVPRFDLISAYLQQRQYKPALEVLQRFGDTTNSDARLRDWRGVAKIGIGETTDGLADLRAAAELAPGIPDFHLNLGAVLHRLHRDSEAIAPLTHAIELRPNFAMALIIRAETFVALDRRNEAIADLRRALEVDPRQKSAYGLIARLLKESGEDAEAARWLRRAPQ